jgi:hypothetical protein
MISINTPISDSSNLSGKANTLLGWIPGAKYWLKNAITDTSVAYQFVSEEALIRSILTGLYSTEQIVLKNCDCMAAPEFLMRLSDDQINQIAQGVNNSNMDKASLIALFNQLNIVTGERLTQIQNLFHEWQVDKNFLFQALSNSDIQQLQRLALRIQSTHYDEAVIEGALDFAMKECVDPTSFALLMYFALTLYQALYGTNNAKRLTATVKNKFNTAYDLLSTIVMKRLACPQLHPPQTANDVGNIINQWGVNRRFVGFTDLSTGLLQLISNVDSNLLLSEGDAQSTFNVFEQQYLAFLSQAKVTSQSLSQDAKIWHYRLETASQHADFQLIENGCLTLNQFQTTNNGAQ